MFPEIQPLNCWRVDGCFGAVPGGPPLRYLGYYHLRHFINSYVFRNALLIHRLMHCTGGANMTLSDRSKRGTRSRLCHAGGVAIAETTSGPAFHPTNPNRSSA